MPLTGQGATLSASITDYSGVQFISITPPSGEAAPIETPYLNLAKYSGMPMIPGDLVTHTLEAEIYLDPDFDWQQAMEDGEQTFTITYQLPAGKASAANDQFSGFLVGQPASPMTTGEPATATMRFGVNGNVSKTPSA